MIKKENLIIVVKYIFPSIVAFSAIFMNNSLLLNFSVLTMILIFLKYFKNLFDKSNSNEKMLIMQSFYLVLIVSIIIYFLFDFIFIFKQKKICFLLYLSVFF